MDKAFPISYDTLVTDSITPYGDMDAWTFTGSAGDSVIIRMRETSGDINPKLELFGPEDTLIVSTYDGSQANIVDQALPTSGTYTIFCSDLTGNNTASYWLSFEYGIDITPPEFYPEQTDVEDVPIDGYVTGTFSEPIDTNTLDSTTFFVTSYKTGAVGGKIKYFESTLSLEFTPYEFFPPDDTIKATLTDSVKDLAGNKLKHDTTWQFVSGPGVYPGDTNNDGVVNEVDVLPLGIHWLMSDSSRDSTGIEWAVKPVKYPWAERAATYADANGDGIVDIQDLDAIRQNWDSTHAYANPTLTPKDLDSLAEYYLNKDAFEQLYDGLKEDGSESGVKIKEILEAVIFSDDSPDKFSLSQNYPNPFNPETEIQYFLPRATKVELIIYNILGEKVKTLVSQFEAAGMKRVRWEATNDRGDPVASGIYFYRIKAGEFSQFEKMVLMR